MPYIRVATQMHSNVTVPQLLTKSKCENANSNSFLVISRISSFLVMLFFFHTI